MALKTIALKTKIVYCNLLGKRFNSVVASKLACLPYRVLHDFIKLVKERKQFIIKECQLADSEPVMPKQVVVHEKHTRRSSERLKVASDKTAPNDNPAPLKGNYQKSSKRSKGNSGPTILAAEERKYCFVFYYMLVML